MNKEIISLKEHRYFSIDFLKFILVIGMMFRHAPLYLFNIQLEEYSLDGLSIYSFFIPVTSGFIFILGYTLGLSLTGKKEYRSFKKHILNFFKLFLLSILFSIITFLLREPKIQFFDYYLYYIYNTPDKPGFYILLPISLLIGLYSFIRFSFTKHFMEIIFLLAIICFIITFFFNFYWSYYLSFGLIGIILSMVKTIKYKLNKFDVNYLIFSSISYISIFYLNIKINYFIELLMLLLFSILMINIANLFESFLKRIKAIIFLSNNILLYYIMHVLILNILSKLFHLDSWLQITVFCTTSIFCMNLIIHVIRRIIPREVI